MSSDTGQSRSKLLQALGGWGTGFAIGGVMVFLYLLFASVEPADPGGRAFWFMMGRLGDLWSLTGDPVLNFLIDLVLLMFLAAAIYGAVRVGVPIAVGMLAVGFGLGLLGIALMALAGLAQVSATGALVATAIPLVAAGLVLRRLVRRYWEPALEAAAHVWVFFRPAAVAAGAGGGFATHSAPNEEGGPMGDRSEANDKRQNSVKSQEEPARALEPEVVSPAPIVPSRQGGSLAETALSVVDETLEQVKTQVATKTVRARREFAVEVNALEAERLKHLEVQEKIETHQQTTVHRVATAKITAEADHTEAEARRLKAEAQREAAKVAAATAGATEQAKAEADRLEAEERRLNLEKRIEERKSPAQHDKPPDRKQSLLGDLKRRLQEAITIAEGVRVTDEVISEHPEIKEDAEAIRDDWRTRILEGRR